MQRIRNRLTLLDILNEDDFDGHEMAPDVARDLEVNFYRGAPAQWLNFYAAEQGTEENDSIIKRDGYEKLHEILRKGTAGVSEVSFSHEPGSGGTTLAMQLLWDLKSSFRCAVLVDQIPPDISKIAKQVTDLYAAGESDNRKPVLLLVEGEVLCRKRFVEEMSKGNNRRDRPKVVILKCVRMVMADVHLSKELSDGEKIQFDKKREWLLQKYNQELAQFHGFNIMQTNFSQDAATRPCDVFNNIGDLRSKVKKRALKLSACMCLLNWYVPGSVLLKSQCQAFLKSDETRMFEEKMEPFSHLIVSYPAHGSDDRCVRMAHPMIAEQGTLSLQRAGVDKSVTVRALLRRLCQGNNTPSLTRFVKDLLTKRETNSEGRKDLFSRLILDIEKHQERCLSILKEAAETFPEIGHFPQTLSRFYYLKCNNYKKAKKWAVKAIKIAPRSSFIADTLGQVHKQNLKKQLSDLRLCDPETLPEILALAEKAFEAFNHAEGLAENEHKTNIFHLSGKFGFLDVANTLFEKLENPLQYEQLQAEIKERAEFINMLLSYSKKSNGEERDFQKVKTCYRNYTGGDLPEGQAITGPTEEHLSALLLNWRPYAQKRRGAELKAMVQNMKRSYETTYKKYFKSRDLVQLRSLLSDGIWVRDEGRFHDYKLYIKVGKKEIELDVDTPQQRFCRSGPVSFQLGFTIRGPTAYNIKNGDN